MKTKINVCKKCVHHKRWRLEEDRFVDECMHPNIPGFQARYIYKLPEAIYNPKFIVPDECPYLLEHVVE